MLGFGLAVAAVVSVGLSLTGFPLWAVVAGGTIAGAGGTLLAPRSRKAITAQQDALALKAKADAVQEADWQLKASHEKLGF
jgi:type III secretory pathway component EscV